MGTRKRDTRVDILKGIGIILMVIGHAYFPGRDFIYLFHMAIFFMATGYLFKDMHSDSVGAVGKYIGRRVLTLWVPYVVADTIYNLLNNVFLSIHFFTKSMYREALPGGGMIMTFPAKTLSASDIWHRFLSACHFQGSAEFGLAMWFLQALFGVTVLYVLIDYVIKQMAGHVFHKNQKLRVVAEDVLLGIIAVAFLRWGSSMPRAMMMKMQGFEKSLTCFILMYLGHLLQRYFKKLVFDSSRRLWVLGGVSLVGLIIASGKGAIELSANQITSPVFFVAVSLMGWFFVFAISDVADHCRIAGANLTGIKGVMQKGPALALGLCGRDSLAIVILHMLVFRVLNVFVVWVYGLPTDAIAAMPVVTSHGAWWALYGVVGVCVPVILNEVRKYVWRKIRK